MHFGESRKKLWLLSCLCKSEKMSDRQSKNYDEAAKQFFSSVAGRTRSRRDAYVDAIVESRGISAPNARIVESPGISAANARYGSGGISAPIAQGRKRKNVGKSRASSSSCNYVGNNGLEGESDSDGDCPRRKKRRRRRNQLMPMRVIGRPEKNLGNKSADMDMEKIDIEIIDEAEFKSKKICSASRRGDSTMQESNEVFSADNSWENVNITSRKPSASPDFFPEDVSDDSAEGLLVKKGNGDGGTDLKGTDIERIEEAEFINQKTKLTSKIGSSSKEELDEGYSAVTPKKDVSDVSKKASSADYCEFSYPEDACHGSDHAWPHESSSLVRRGSNNENMVPEEIEIEKIDEAEFRKTCSESKIRRSVERGFSAASFSKNVDSASKNISSADHSVSFSPKYCCIGSDVLKDDSSPLPEGNKNEPTSCGEIKIKQIDEAEFRNGKPSIASKKESSTMQGYSAANSTKNGDIVKEVSFDNCYRSLSSEDAGRDSDKGQSDKSSSFAEKGDNDEDTDSESLGIEKIDESEFRKKIGASTSQKPDEEHFAATPQKNLKSVSKKMSSVGKIDKNKMKREVSSYSGRKRKDEASSSVECVSSDTSGEFNSDSTYSFLQDEEISSYGAKDEMKLGIASRTRSKLGSIKKPREVGKFSQGLSLDSDSSSTKVETDDSERIEMCSFAEEVQNNISMKVEKTQDCNEQEGNSVKHAANRKHLNLQNQESNSKQPTFQKQESSSRKRQLSDDASSKPKGVKAQKTCDVSEENEDKNRTSADNADADEGFKEESELAKFGCSKQLNAQNECNEANGDNGLHPEKKSPPNIRRQNKAASPSHSKDDYSNGGGGDDIHRKIEATSSDLLGKVKHTVKHASKQMEGGTAQRTCEVNEEDVDDANIDEDSKHPNAQNDCDKPNGVNGLHPKEKSQAEIRMQKKAASPSHLKDDCNDDDDDDDDIHKKNETANSDLHGDGKTKTVDVAAEIKEPIRRKQVSSKQYDFCSMLADAVLGRGPMLETKGSNEEATEAAAPQTQDTLPLKFCFEDEVPKEVEKTEHEKEMEDLFAELDFNWALEELGSFDNPEVDQENENPPADETHHARCAKGKHELVLQDDQGLTCIFCHHVELGPKDILPEWVERIYQDMEKKRHSETEQHLEFDEFHLQSSVDNVADFGDTADGTVWSIKPGVRESMYEHQQEGFEFLWKNLAGSINLDELKSADPGGVGGCIISHAPGTGKTRLTIVFIETYLKMFPNCQPVIIAPASMLLTWEEEFRKWNVQFPFLNLNNPDLLDKENKLALGLLDRVGKENTIALGLLARAKRRNVEAVRMVKICSWSTGGSILGISYSLFEKLTGEKHIKGKTSRKTLTDQEEKMRKILLEKPGLVILDEGHYPRNQRSNIWNVLLKLQTEKRVILSGTPFQNNFGELFNTLRLVRPAIAGVLAQEKTFSEMFASRRMSSSRKHKGEHSQTPLISEVVDRAVEKLKISMSPFVHVHKGTILQQSLPGLRDCVVLLKPPALQKTLIERLEGSASTFEFEHKVALISVHPYLFEHVESTEEERIGIDMGAVKASKLNPNEGVKTKFILELVRLSMLMKEKVLIFSQYIQPLRLLKEQLKGIFKWVDGKQILQMQGKLEQKQRQILINLFNDPQSEAKIMLASTRCCSEGISLVGASRVVLLDVVWNPSVERQAICRAYRIGQKKFVYTYHLMTSGTTEADKYCRQAEKERLSELVFSSSSNESSKQKHPSLCIEDRILEEMVGRENLKEMFEKIINQPKETDLIQTFGLTS